MKLEDYLKATKKIALEEKEILDELSQKKSLSPIEKRAVKSSLQVLIANMVGKVKRTLKHYNCPIVPQRGRDALNFL